MFSETEFGNEIKKVKKVNRSLLANGLLTRVADIGKKMWDKRDRITRLNSLCREPGGPVHAAASS
jgi:hypothetical protein